MSVSIPFQMSAAQTEQLRDAAVRAGLDQWAESFCLTTTGERSATLRQAVSFPHPAEAVSLHALTVPGAVAEDVLSAAALDILLPFQTREQYLAWRTEWRAQYATTTALLRGLRLCLAQPHGVEWAATRFDQQLQRTLRGTARALLALRAASKRRAGQQMAQAVAR